jgi:subtilisin family serine protease
MSKIAYLLLLVLIILTGTAAAEPDGKESAPVAASPNIKIDRIVVKFNEQAIVRLRDGELVSLSKADLTASAELLRDITVSRLFQRSEKELDAEFENLQEIGVHSPVDKNSYFQIKPESVEQAVHIVNMLRKLPVVETAYIEPEPEPAQDIPPPTPDFSGSQGYLYNPPEGIGASYCWSIPGGTGSGVDIIDIEGNWNNDHEDFGDNFGAILAGTPVPLLDWINHGTATTGMVGGDSNEYGITGIAYDAHIDMISTGDIGFAAAIDIATSFLGAGDIIMIELHTPGPRYDFDPRPDQMGYVPMEYFRANFDAIQMAAAKGIVVVEAAGNGYENLDDAIYESRFDRSFRDSRAIVVGAGAPPNGLYGPDRTRLYFSNFGSRVDLQGWGKSVVTTGYGDLFDGDIDLDQFYTETFSGTSSATPMVAGAVACMLGIYKAQHGFSMTPEAVTALLTNT